MVVADYERPAVEIIEEETSTFVYFRSSQATACNRQLFYAGIDEPKSDAVPAEAKARMEMGKALEPIILDMMVKDYGWTMVPVNSRVYKVQTPDPDIYLTGIPDAVGFHPELTEGKNAVIEIKTRNANQWRNTKMQGAWRAHFSAVVQLAMYREAMLDAGVIEPETPAVLTSMNKDTCELHFEWFRPEVLDEAISLINERLVAVVDSWMEEDQIPAPEYEASSWQCKSCEWRTTCGNVLEEGKPEFDFGPDKVTEEEAMQALLEWEQAKLKEVSIDKAINEYSRALLLRYAQGLGATSLRMEGATSTWNISVKTREGVKLNEELVRYYLKPEEWLECLQVNTGEPYVEIRKGRKTASK